MKFEKSFFHDEVREGFYISSMMKRCWSVMIDVLDKVTDICRRNNIQCFVDYGTLLGAVRHKGFVPWDDDMDISVRRSDLARFTEVMRAQLPSDWYVLECDSQDENYFNPWYRIVTSRVVQFEEKQLERYNGFRFPAGLDVFILDYMPGNEEEIDVLKNLNDIIYQICFDENPTDEQFESWICAIEDLLNIHIERGTRKQQKSAVMKLLQTLMSMYTEEDSDLYTKCCATYYGKRRYPVSWFDEVVYLPFENIQVPAPKEYIKVVTEIYRDYTVRKRGGGAHTYPAYRKNVEQLEKVTGENHLYLPGKDVILANPARTPEKKEGEVVFFLPYKASSWNFFEDAWRAESANEKNTVIVMPIPYFEKHFSGALEEQVYDPQGYPDYVNVTKLSDINIEAFDIDRIYIQQPYDERNLAISVHPYFYSPHMRKMCRQLIYIPDFELVEFESKQDVCFATFEHFAAMPGLVYSDKVIVQSENIRKMYIEYLSDWAGEDTRGHWEKKIVSR